MPEYPKIESQRATDDAICAAREAMTAGESVERGYGVTFTTG